MHIHTISYNILILYIHIQVYTSTYIILYTPDDSPHEDLLFRILVFNLTRMMPNI